jgi:hypothetical protein
MIQIKNEQKKSVTLKLEKKTDIHVILTNFFLVQVLKSSSFEYFESRKKKELAIQVNNKKQPVLSNHHREVKLKKSKNK